MQVMMRQYDRHFLFARHGILLICLVLLVNGCSWVVGENRILKDRRTDYKKARTAPTLEVPPDLSKSSIRDQMVIPSTGEEVTSFSLQHNTTSGTKVASVGRVLPLYEGLQIKRDGSRRWLVVRGSAETVWPRMISFWQDLGLLLTVEDPDVGIMETDWVENRADIGGGIIRNILKKSLLGNIYSSPTRDKFRVRLEHGQEANSTEIYLTHRGMEETDRSSDSDTNTIIIWQPRPADPEIEAEMLNRLMVYLGLEAQEAKQMIAKAKQETARRISLIKKDTEGVAILRIEAPFPRSWQLIGLALDRVGFTVQDRIRAEGLYFVRYTDPYRDHKERGWLSRFAFWASKEKEDPTEYLVKLQDQGQRTEVLVLDAQRQRDNSSTAIRILTLLHEQFL